MASSSRDSVLSSKEEDMPSSNLDPASPQRAPPSATTPRTRIVRQRTRTGCLTCRARKVKCDETQPSCQNCRRCVLECKWPVVGDVLSSRSRRKKVQAGTAHTSAAAPHSGNPNSHGSRGSDEISRSDTGTPTAHSGPISDGNKTPRSDFIPAQESRAASRSAMGQFSAASPARDGHHHDVSEVNIDKIPKHIIHEHINIFFSHIYHCQANAFIHRGTFLRQFQEDRVDRKLLLAMCAASARFVTYNDSIDNRPSPTPNAQPDHQAKAWCKEAKTLLILEDMSMDTVATALILAKHEIHKGNFGGAWMLSAIANRAALSLGLNKESVPEDNSLSFAERETKRRLFWGCYCLDRMMSTGLPHLISLRPEHIHLHLPCEEHHYLYGIPCRTPIPVLEVQSLTAADYQALENSPPDTDVGLFGHFVQIMDMRFCILSYVRNHPEDKSKLPPWDNASIFVSCQRKMARWKRSLSPQFQLLPDTIFARQAQDELSTLVMLHVWYDQCMSDLYRITMPGFPETLPDAMLREAPGGWVQQQQLNCIRHATGILSTLKTVANLVNMDTFVFLDTGLPICVFECIRVQLQWLFMLPSDSIEQRIIECQASCETLMSFVKGMRKYFRQAHWLLREMRKMLLRHDIPIREMSEPIKDLFSNEQGSHPWQRRIQSLNNTKSPGTSPDSSTPGPNAPNLNNNRPLNSTETEPNNTVAGIVGSAAGNLNPVIDLDFPDHGNILYQNEDMRGGEASWGDMQMLPGFPNFIGTANGWLADGIHE